MSDKGKSETAKREEGVVEFWKENQIFEKTLRKWAPKGEFIFYDGPPFATGLPHHGSLLSSVIKDVIPRYKTMQGYRVPRRWGWDCHGLPIESLIEKRLNLKTKKDILSIGIDTFNEAARASVMEFEHEWEKYIDRIGRFVDFKNSYKTMDNSYMESVWWALKKLHGKKMLYEGRKVLMYCPHCETPLAKAEIAMDNTYKDITEEAVTVKFKIKNPLRYNLPERTYLLAWTTTPWTLPGNIALAVGKDIDYQLIEKDGEHFIKAGPGSVKGAQLVGMSYEPLFDVPALHGMKSYKVYAADFVNTDEGTGIVHTAVMYGEDDYALGQKEGLPMIQLLNANGTYNDAAPEFIRGEYYKKAEKVIKAHLEEQGLLFKKENHTHSYPHCYRCGTALIYSAVPSWFINIQKVKKSMLAQNERVNWVPAHLKHGRFKHIVENAPDWTISRNRFWASALPIWKEKGGSRLMVIGSLKELLEKTKKSGNTYFVMRHAEAGHNVEGVDDPTGDPANHVTEKGRTDAIHVATVGLKRGSIDLIVTSPFLRTRETAALVQKELRLPESAVMVDERLREASETAHIEVRRRIGEFIFEIERRYTGKRILIISHGNPLWVLQQVAARRPSNDFSKEYMLKTSEVRKLSFTPFPHNKDYGLDLHRPYIDAVTLVDSKGRGYERIPEVVDCWVESGTMPYASNHYPFENKEVFNPGRLWGLWPKGFPAHFIAEYIAQTRTWFYYMHAMGVLLSNQQSFRSVVSTGTILAADGAKMSKSKGNYTDPLQVMDQFGADALRLYLMGSVVMSGEDINFRDEDVREAHNRTIGILWNSYKFFELYKSEWDKSVKAENSPHVLDRWVLSLLGKTTKTVTEAMDAYDTPTAVRALRSFVEDYSTWYVRRSRDRARGEDITDKKFALATQREVLYTLSCLMAPVTPFVAESIYQGLGAEKESVHLESWPAPYATDEALLSDMAVVRSLASQGLKLREEAGIKVRQPLFVLKVRKLPADHGLVALVADELNVKEVVEDSSIDGDAWLDATLTPELQEEGVVRTLIRRVQEWRKEEGLTIADRPSYTLNVAGEEKEIAEKYRNEILKETGLESLTISEE